MGNVQRSLAESHWLLVLATNLLKQVKLNVYSDHLYKKVNMATQLARPTIRLLPRHEVWLEATAREKQRSLAEVLRACVASSMRKRYKHMETYASDTKPKTVYLARKQLDVIAARCQTHGGTMSGLIRRAIDEQMYACTQKPSKTPLLGV